MAPHFTHHRRVAFSETDMAGIVHFAQYFNYMEAAEHAMFRSLGLSVHGQYEGCAIGWPRVAVSCDFKAPLRFEDAFAINLTIEQIKPRSVAIGHEFRKQADQQLVAEGRMTIVCARLDEASGKMSAVEIPTSMLAKLQNLTNRPS